MSSDGNEMVPTLLPSISVASETTGWLVVVAEEEVVFLEAKQCSFATALRTSIPVE
jgi:hypothetical protein